MNVQGHRLRDASNVTIDPLDRKDEAEVAALLRALPERDLLFVGFDVNDDAVIRQFTAGAVARRDGKILGFAILQRDRAKWKRHLGSILVVVLPAARGLGLGTLLVHRTIQLASELGLERIVARMLVEDRDTVRVFEKLGFRHEGLLIDHAKASDGTLYDIAYMGLSLRKASSS
jgi:RimJ/RimL family protein N-acetyltransferase